MRPVKRIGIMIMAQHVLQIQRQKGTWAPRARYMGPDGAETRHGNMEMTSG